MLRLREKQKACVWEGEFVLFPRGGMLRLSARGALGLKRVRRLVPASRTSTKAVRFR